MERQAMIAHLRRNGWLGNLETWDDASLSWLNDRTPRPTAEVDETCALCEFGEEHEH